MTHLRVAWDYLWALGVPGNVVATPVIFGLGVVTDRLLFRPARKRRERLLEETHRLLHRVHPEQAAELGHAMPDTPGRSIGS